MFLRIINIDNNIFNEAKDLFNIEYIKNKSKESIVARYIINNEFKKQGINNN